MLREIHCVDEGAKDISALVPLTPNATAKCHLKGGKAANMTIEDVECELREAKRPYLLSKTLNVERKGLTCPENIHCVFKTIEPIPLFKPSEKLRECSAIVPQGESLILMLPNEAICISKHLGPIEDWQSTSNQNTTHCLRLTNDSTIEGVSLDKE